MPQESIGSIVNSLPIETMVAAPVLAAVNAQKSISRGMADFIQEVGLDKDGNMRMVTFRYKEQIQDEQGDLIEADRYIQAPFLSLTGVPNFAMEEVNVSFDLEVNTVEEEKSNTAGEAKADGKLGFFLGPKINFSTSVTHRSEQTRRTDTRAKYSFNVSARRQEAPESFLRLIDAVTASVSNPTASQPALSDNLTGEDGKPTGQKTGKK